MAKYMNASLPLDIWGAQTELAALEGRRRDGGLNELEKEDYPYLKKYVGEHQRDYQFLDYEGREVFEVWRRYLYDQRTMSGSLLTSEIFGVLDRVLPADIGRETYMRVFDLIKRIDEIAVRYGKKEKSETDGKDSGLEAGQS